jgi:hypothetical protein
MENNSEHLLEKDAAPIGATNTEVVEYLDTNQCLESTENNRTVNNMMVASQTNSSSILRFDNCRNVTLGNVFNVGGWMGNAGVVARSDMVPLKGKEPPYSKTPTVKAMMESSDPITPAFLDILSGYFGARWKEVTILLQINQLFVERMFEDNNERGGTKEVIRLKLDETNRTIIYRFSFLCRSSSKFSRSSSKITRRRQESDG